MACEFPPKKNYKNTKKSFLNSINHLRLMSTQIIIFLFPKARVATTFFNFFSHFESIRIADNKRDISIPEQVELSIEISQSEYRLGNKFLCTAINIASSMLFFSVVTDILKDNFH